MYAKHLFYSISIFYCHYVLSFELLDFNSSVKPLYVFNQAPPRHITSRGTIETRYEVGKTIGDGNFAVVREARLRNTESEFAMKIIDKSKLKGKEEMIG